MLIKSGAKIQKNCKLQTFIAIILYPIYVLLWRVCALGLIGLQSNRYQTQAEATFCDFCLCCDYIVKSLLWYPQNLLYIAAVGYRAAQKIEIIRQAVQIYDNLLLDIAILGGS